MELTLAEFACFNLKSKQQILNYKGNYVCSMVLSDGNSLMLYTMNGNFITALKSTKTGEVVQIDSVVNKDILYLFAEKLDLAGFVN